jgi:predicted ArsR family transcriptional regulator
MGFLDSLEKLINEHGSAAILKERIALLNDRYVDLEHKAEERGRALAEARTEIERLKGEVARLTQEVQRNAPRGGVAVDEMPEQILLVLAKGELQVEQIAHAVGGGVEATKFHLEEMAEKDLIYVSYSALAPARYSLGQEGRRYLVGKGLIR